MAKDHAYGNVRRLSTRRADDEQHQEHQAFGSNTLRDEIVWAGSARLSLFPWGKRLVMGRWAFPLDKEYRI
jgi:hypothetical protein